MNKDFQKFNIKAKQCLQSGNLSDAYTNFVYANNATGCLYCNFLKGNLEETVEILKVEQGLNPFVNWLLCLIDIINDERYHIPTYFQIRNFYETDMDMLFLYKNFDFIKKIYSNINYLAKYNLEIYKYTAKVFIENQLINEAINLIKKGIDVCYKDPEIHYMLAEIYYKNGDINKAKDEFKKSNDAVNGYYPAIKRLEELKIY